jgi:hypothetical protein
MTWANEDPDRLHTPTWYGLKPALMSPPSLVEGGGEWPHLPDWVPEVRCDDQGGDEAVCVGLVSRCRLKNLQRRLAVPPLSLTILHPHKT